MNVLVFDLTGCFAHFRKFYTNSTSLSYEFPPPTTVFGIVAGILGMSKDSYYEQLNERTTFLAVRIMHPTKRMNQTVNYLWVKEKKHLNGSGGRIQIPVEWVVAQPGVGVGALRYRIYFHHKDEKIYDQLKLFLKEDQSIYPPYLGITEAPAKIEWVGEFSVKAVKLSGKREIATVTPMHMLTDIDFPKSGERRRMYMRDRVPCSFSAQRQLQGITSVIYEPNGQTIVAEVKNELFYVECSENKGDGVWILPIRSEGSYE